MGFITNWKSGLTGLLVVLLTATVIFAGDTESGEDPVASEALYTAHNIWFEKPESIHAINYKRGSRIPAGTEVEILGMDAQKIRFTSPDWEGYVFVLLLDKYQADLNIRQLRERTFVPADLTAQTVGMTEHEIGCIDAGIVEFGMSREAVLISQGYPPRHRTPNLKMRQWFYWSNRFRSFTVEFDKNGKVVN